MKVNQFGELINSYENAKWIREHLEDYAIAVPIALGNSTKLFVSFVPLWQAIPKSCERAYSDGSELGLQINIQGYKSFSYPFKLTGGLISQNFLIEHVGLQSAEAWIFADFLSTVVSGENCFFKKNVKTD